MPRPLKVSREKSLQSAMMVFWSKGYNATSIDDLQEAIGIQRGSFYFNFKGKRELFFEVLEHYKKNVVEKRRALVLESLSAKKGIELFFEILIQHSITNPSHAGCLNTNSATELGLVDHEISNKLSLGVKTWQKFWGEILDKAKKQNEVSSDLNIETTAQLLVALTQGLNVIGKVYPDPKFLRGVVKSGLTFLN